ncbi:protein sel-1 homolog 3 [Aplysia californica]|uniref:Protein sel-1 homolog 3 n=1 Tax=Aplysia californica TaxID=6500 RepID=A0ABM1AC34_APLCA|nr:protein sel-1 homolog 3 [Aplysia californica]
MTGRNYIYNMTSFASVVLAAVLYSRIVTASQEVILDADFGHLERDHQETHTSNVRITKAPSVLKQLRKVTVEYYCEEDSVIVLDLSVMLQDADAFSVAFSKAWICQGQHGEGAPRLKSIHLRLPRPLAYRPDYFNKEAWRVTGAAKIRAWLVNFDTWLNTEPGGGDLYASARCRDFQSVKVLPPYSRPHESPPCAVWYWSHAQRSPRLSDTDHCPLEQELVTFLNYPAVFNGNAYGIVRQLFPHHDPGLEAGRVHTVWAPQLTIEMWVYFLEFCPLSYMSPTGTCGLLLHIDRQGLLLSPSLLVHENGNIQVDILGKGGHISRLTIGKATKNVWTRILFTLNSRTWSVHVNHGKDLEEGFWTVYTYDEDVFVDDTYGLWNLGGLDWQVGSFIGYMGRAIFHRRRVLESYQIPRPDPFHPMFELHLTSREEKCQNFLVWMDSAVSVYQRYQKYLLRQRANICPNEGYRLFEMFLPVSGPELRICPMRHPRGLRHHRPVKRLLRKAVQRHSLSWNFLDGEMEAYSRRERSEGREVLLNISQGLISNATDLVSDKGLAVSTRAVQLLKQAACLGSDDAMFSLAVLLNNGVGAAVDEIQSLAFFMLGTLNRHILSIMALGHRHVMGIDGAPVDRDAAFMYYKQVADQSRRDKEEHKDSEIATESIRLIDEARIDAQTSEVGDLFLWLKHQAQNGVATAQSELGLMMYHGAQGLQRNLQNAMQVFREGAEMGNVDAMFNYGIMEYRGIGVRPNRTRGRKMVEKAAKLKNPHAMTALGWMALEIDHNMTQALNMFRKAKFMGHMDSGYYLGHMYHYGMVPQHPVDLDKALEEYLWSGNRGQIDAGTLYAFLVSRGTPKYPRDIYFGTEWARFIGEKNSFLAKPLREALNAFRDGNHALALYLYLLLADTGLEVASFNLAYLCEQNRDGVTSYLSKECQWRHYNMTTQREFHQVDAYSYIKMGDYYWYGCRGRRDLGQAALHYSYAALKGDPHALFNLAYMVEEGAPVVSAVWNSLQIPVEAQQTNVSLLLELYARCRESLRSEAFIPCSLAWFRVWCRDVWEQYHVYMKVTSVCGAVVVCMSVIFLCAHFLQQRRLRRDEESQREAEREEEDRMRAEEERERHGDGESAAAVPQHAVGPFEDI